MSQLVTLLRLPLISALAHAAALFPDHLRVDLHLGAGPFVTLDTPYGVSTNLSFAWALPAGIPVQSAARIVISTPSAASSNTTTYDSGWVAGAAQLLGLPRSMLSPATAYAWTVAVRDAHGVASAWAVPQTFFTSAGTTAWAATSPVWAPACGGGAPPAFAYFRGALPVRTDVALLSALLYVTGSPPIYNDRALWWWHAARAQRGRSLRFVRLHGQTLLTDSAQLPIPANMPYRLTHPPPQRGM